MWGLPLLYSITTVISLIGLIGSTLVVLWYLYRVFRNRQDVRDFPKVFAFLAVYFSFPVFISLATVVSLFEPIIEVEISLLAGRAITTAIMAFSLVKIYPRVIRVPSVQQLEEEYKMYQARKRISLEGQITTRDGMIVEANPKASVIYGYTQEEFKNMDMMLLVHPNDREMIRNYRKLGFDGKYECKGLHKSGKTLFLEVRGENVNYHGALERITAIKDLTSERLKEQKLLEKIEIALIQLNAREVDQITEEKKAEVMAMVQDARKDI